MLDVGLSYMASIMLRYYAVAQIVKNLPAVQEIQLWFLGQEGPLEKEVTTHSSILAWNIPWTEEPGRLQSMGSQRVRHDWATNTSLHVEYMYSIPTFWRVFIITRCQKLFCIYWDDHMVFILQFINMMYHIDWFVYSEESLHSWDQSHLILVYDPFGVLLDSVY